MKKCILIFTIIAITATGAFAQISFSAGGGIFTDMSIFGNGMKYTGNDEGYKGYREGTRNISFGPYIFFDATYAEVALSLGFGSLLGWDKIGDEKKDYDDKSTSIQQLGFTVLGKYPIDMGVVTIFPLLGVSYNMVLAGKYDGKKIEKQEWTDYEGKKQTWSISHWNQFGLLAGAGADYDLNSNLYLRAQVMLQMRFANKDTRDNVKDEDDVSSTLGFGPVIRVGVGYRF